MLVVSPNTAMGSSLRSYVPLSGRHLYASPRTVCHRHYIAPHSGLLFNSELFPTQRRGILPERHISAHTDALSCPGSKNTGKLPELRPGKHAPKDHGSSLQHPRLTSPVAPPPSPANHGQPLPWNSSATYGSQLSESKECQTASAIPVSHPTRMYGKDEVSALGVHVPVPEEASYGSDPEPALELPLEHSCKCCHSPPLNIAHPEHRPQRRRYRRRKHRHSHAHVPGLCVSNLPIHSGENMCKVPGQSLTNGLSNVTSAMAPSGEEGTPHTAATHIQRWWRRTRATAHMRQDDQRAKLQHLSRRLEELRQKHHADALQAPLSFRQTRLPVTLGGLPGPVNAAVANKSFLEYEDAVTKLLLEADMVESLGSDSIRCQRKELIRRAHAVLEELDRFKLCEWERVVSACGCDDSATVTSIDQPSEG